MEQIPTIGRIVHYVIQGGENEGVKSNGRNAGYELPAIIVAVWPNEFGEGVYGVNLQVFSDNGGVIPLSSVKLVEGVENGTCHWPERV
jgi:hypothetical protein